MAKVDFSSTFYENAVTSEIRSNVIDQKANSCPMAIRLAWHASGTFDQKAKNGGSNGATMRFAPENTDGANAGLGIERDILCPVKRAFPEVSNADIWTLAGAKAVEFCGGPKIDFNFGRTDAADNSSCPPNGRLPDASQGAEHLRQVFTTQMGFNDREIVALSGAHTLGRCHKTRSGFDGPWTQDPLNFDNTYFTNLMNMEWTERKWDGPKQFQDPSGTLMMLPTDIALKTDPIFKPIAQEYANDEAKFFSDFSAAFAKLLALGCPDEAQPGAKKASTDSDTKSREMREHCMHGSIEHAQALVAGGADVNSLEANSGRTALHKAAFWGHGNIVGWLIGAKINVNVADYAGDTALHDAARFGHVECAKQLVAAGADKNATNKKGETAAAVGESCGHGAENKAAGL